jgi:predicted dehydrogenase
MAKDRPTRIGIIGLGFGLDVHLPAFRSLDGVEIVALMGKREARAVERWNVSATNCLGRFFDYKPDAVSVAVPPTEVEKLVSECLVRKLPVLCEKPLGGDAATARRLCDLAAKITTAIDFEFAELETFRALRRLIHEGKLGGVRHVEITWLTESWAHRSSTWSWKTDAGRHGGVLNLLGTHVLYLLEELFGKITRVSARIDSGATEQFKPAPNLCAAEDLVHALFEHDSGMITSMTIGNANPAMSIHRWTVVGALGSAVLENATRDYMGGFSISASDTAGKQILYQSEQNSGGDGRVRPFARLAKRFLDAVTTGGRCTPGFVHGLRVQTLVDAVRLAAVERRWLDIRGQL